MKLALAICAALALGCSHDAKVERAAPARSDEALIHFGGDVYFGEAYRSALSNVSAAERYEAPLDGLREALSGGAVVANLESPLIAEGGEPVDEDKDYLHWSDPEATAAALAKNGFVGLSLSNNHTMDYGLAALESTRRILGARGLTPFGAGANDEQAREPLTLHAPGEQSVTVLGAFWYRRRYEESYKFYADGERGGVRQLATDVLDQVRELNEEAPERLIVVFPHWGRNYRWRSKKQRHMAHALIEAGADLVIGHGAHMYQQVERYRDRWILYGLGNLVFLAPGRYDEKDAPPFSMLATLRTHERRELVLRFIASDNLATDYKPHLAMGSAFDDAFQRIRDKSCRKSKAFCEQARTDEDGIGPHVRLPL